MRRITSLLLLLLLATPAFASDYKQDGQGHTIIYSVTDTNGDPVTTLNPRVAIKRMTDGLFLDWSDNTYKTSNSCTTLFQSMTYEQAGGFYYRIFSVDNAALVSADYITILSSDDATYGDTQAENISWDNLNNLIKIHR